MSVIITNTRPRWHHPLTIIKNRTKKVLAFVGLITVVAAVAYFVGTHR